MFRCGYLQAALIDTRIPHIEVSMGEEGEEPELDLDDDPLKAAALDTSRVPIIVSIAQVDVSPLSLKLKRELCILHWQSMSEQHAADLFTKIVYKCQWADVCCRLGRFWR